MSFYSMLDDYCDIYHIVRTDVSPGYGLQASPSFSYAATPDIAGQRCHFHRRSGSVRTIRQLEPQTIYDAKVKLSLPFGVDVRLNDKIVNTENGLEYTADVPMRIRQHHIVVWLRRVNEQLVQGLYDNS